MDYGTASLVMFSDKRHPLGLKDQQGPAIQPSNIAAGNVAFISANAEQLYPG